MNKSRIDCHLHDYIEIACLYKLEVLITLINGQQLIGMPITTKVVKQSGEFLSFKESDTARQNSLHLLSINLLSIKSMKASSKNLYFDSISFIQCYKQPDFT